MQQVLDEVSQRNKIELLSEVTREKPPTHVLRWNKDEYVIDTVSLAGNPKRLGKTPTAKALLDAIAGNATAARLWVLLPPEMKVGSEIELGAGSANPFIEVTDDASDATYFLAGRIKAGVPEYAWVVKDSVNAIPGKARLPLSTDWKRSGKDLTALALSLGRIYGWLNLESPPGDNTFPYKLTFEGASTGLVAGPDPLRIGEKYKIVFAADAAALRRAENSGEVDKRDVYVFAIDSDGKSECLFPEPANGNEGNRIPRGEIPEPRILATRYPYDIVISPPAGTDNYFLVTSREPLDPSLFQWSGVRTDASARRGNGSALEMLFSSVREGRRGVTSSHPVPVSWSIQSMPVQSVL